jgi:CRISPR-associated endonuclease/helicase Cas3
MSDYQIRLKPVYSQTVSTPDGLVLPANWNLAWHQLATLEALRDPAIDVVVNTAMTGDGKSLAAYLLSMTVKCYSTLAMYPTNELARDQERQVNNYKQRFQPQCDSQIYRLTGATLESFVDTNSLSSKQQGLINLVDNSEILLTNPDIFHYIHDFRYLRRDPKKPNKGDNADKLLRKIDESYKLFIFDEFHIFSSPQIASIVNAMLLIKHTATPRKFLFLSATPSEMLLEFLERSGFRTKVIDPAKNHSYRFEESDSGQWRQISQPIDLKFVGDLQPNSRSGYDWIVENAEKIIIQFFLEHVGSKGAIILNSIASVYNILGILKPLFEKHGLTVLPNTSLTGESERSRSISDADLLIGTSTIDVGVDFRINFLIFEAADAGNFIQRFGRLGRHPGFPAYRAYALIPNYLVARLFAGKNSQIAPLANGEAYDRATFTEFIRNSWSFVNQFENYPQRWGAIQSACMQNELRSLHMKTTYPAAEKDFWTDIEAAFSVNLRGKHGQVMHCIREKQHKIIDEARSFRGSSQLNCAIYDATNRDEPERDRFKTYHLPGLLSNFIFEPELIERDRFLAMARERGLSTKRFDDALCYLRVLDYRDMRENWHFYHLDARELARLGKVQILKGLEVTLPPNAISKALSRRGIVCYISDRRLADLRASLGLPMQFQAYGLSDRLNDRDPPHTIAFGKSALMLETLTWRWKPQEDVGWIC